MSYGQITHQNERLWANHSPKINKLANNFFLANCSFAIFLAKNEQFAEKTMTKFPSLGTTNNISFLKTQNQPTLLYKGVCYCTNLAYIKSACTTVLCILEVQVPSHREIIPIFVQTMIYKFHSLLYFTSNVVKHMSKLKIVLFCKIH